MDMDIEMGDAIESAVYVQVDDLPRAEDILVRKSPFSLRYIQTKVADFKQSGELEEPGEVPDEHLGGKADHCDEEDIVIPSKIYISGVNTMHTDDIRAYVKAHFGPVDKVEWIDDGSANLVFGNEITASEAITSLCAMEVADFTALTAGERLPAKPFDEKPEISLQVRLSLKRDKKQAGAALRSRYYLLHPEHDPEKRRKTYYENRSRYRDRETDYWRSGIEATSVACDDQIFDASMYDDAPRQHVSQRKLSYSNSSNPYVSTNRGKELFTSRILKRHRSASPRRDNESHVHMNMNRISNQNKDLAKLIRSRMPAANSGKELFPIKGSEKECRLDQLEKSIGSARLRDEDLPKMVDHCQSQSDRVFKIRGAANQRGSESSGFAIKGAASTNARELFPNKLGTTNAAKELFISSQSHRRQKAQDLFL
ncbi:hypothetical protein E4U21_003896 [Claviceps maximensis]|nr:hypothetical protein E4U21_003896 [Claviceps maximensis]